MVYLKKYPKTFHLPWSESVNDDDVKSLTTDHFHRKKVVITEKMDGENTTLYRDYYHARLLDSPNHPSRNYVKAWHQSMSYHIPEGWRICGENLYAAHSIHYNELKSYFLWFFNLGGN